VSPRELFSTERFKALLFDCDGTIADSMPIHLKAWNQALSHWGAALTQADHDKYAGVPTRRIVELLNQALGLKMPVNEVTRQKEQAYLDLVETVKAVPDVVATIHAFQGVLPMAVVSGSPRESVLKTLEHLKLTRYFLAILGSEDYALGKPAPDGFLGAARKLNVSPQTCLVFEDGELGIQAAIAAQMKFVRVTPERGGFDFDRSDFR
jgi:HAD superfamily hydrolase (TIGR01509 family)